MREARGERGGLARARAREHQHGAFGGQHRLPLRAVETPQIGRVRRVGAGRVWRRDGEVVHARTIREQRAGCPVRRSEEHTSELQSLMRISYAVFCLKKKKE